MRTPKFIRNIKWKLIAVHLTATCLFILASRQLVVLHNIRLIRLIERYGTEEGTRQLTNEPDGTTQIGNFLISLYLAPLIAVLIAFVISSGITIAKKRYWLNSVIVLLASYIIFRFGFFSSEIVKTIFFSFGRLFAELGMIYVYIANGTVLTFLGLAVFFSKRIDNWTVNNEMTAQK